MKLFNPNVEKRLNRVISLLIQSFNLIIYLLIVFLLLAGSVASLTLLYKMYPEPGLQLLKLVFIASKTFVIIAISLVISGVVWLFIGLTNTLEVSRQNRIIKREKFLDDLALKLIKRGVKKSGPKKG